MSSGSLEVHLYGRLRSLAGCSDVSRDCVQQVAVSDGTTIDDVLSMLGIVPAGTSNLFLNGDLSAPSRRVKAGDRLGIFPQDMATLYTWYFPKKT